MFCPNCLNPAPYCQCFRITPLQLISGLIQGAILQKQQEERQLYEQCLQRQRYQQLAYSQTVYIQYENQSLYEHMFKTSWAKTDCGTPTSIQYIEFGENYFQRHKQNYESLSIPKNEKILFHGSPNTCMRIDCGRCSACGIKESGFKISFSGTNISFLRFGRGIYLAPNSSKANDYNKNDIYNYRCTIVSKVNLGNPVRLLHTNQQYSLPSGHHSVYGQAGGDLNYDEYVVYNEKQVLPIGVFIYRLQ
ncbi:hypothetical protein ACTFIR_001976 [Dictyostelium discoideum]